MSNKKKRNRKKHKNYSEAILHTSKHKRAIEQEKQRYIPTPELLSLYRQYFDCDSDSRKE